jgi:FkbM family methyltransferase
MTVLLPVGGGMHKFPLSGTPNRSLRSLVVDELLTRAVKRIRARNAKETMFRNIVVPIDDFISARVIATGRFEATQLEGIELLLKDPEHFGVRAPSGTFIDVGANIGLFTIALSPLFQHTLAIEANPHTFSILQTNALLRGLQNVECVQAAASDCETILTLHVPTNGNLGWASLDRDAGIETTGTLVQCRRLDQIFLERSKGHRVGLIKIDVERHELKVMQGAQEILCHQRPMVLFEALDVAQAAKCASFLSECGYLRFFSFKRKRNGIRILIDGIGVTVEESKLANLLPAPLICAA